MPTSREVPVPRPADWNEFEDMCADLWRKILEDPNIQRFGRQGQPQHGVDIIGTSPSRGRVGIQCKLKGPTTKLTRSEIEKDANDARNLSPPINEFVVATTCLRDSRIQSFVANLSDQFSSSGHFTITVKFWEDINHELVNYKDLYFKYLGPIFNDFFRTADNRTNPAGASEFQKHVRTIYPDLYLFYGQDPTASGQGARNQEELELITSLIQDGDLERASGRLSGLLDSCEDSDEITFARIHFLKAQIALIDQDLEAAKELIIIGCNRAPDARPSRINRVRLAIMSDDTEAALSGIQELLDDFPEDPDIWALRLEVCETAEQLRRLDVPKSVFDNESFQTSRAFACYRLEDCDGVISSLSFMSECEPGNKIHLARCSDLSIALVQELRTRERWADADAHFRSNIFRLNGLLLDKAWRSVERTDLARRFLRVCSNLALNSLWENDPVRARDYLDTGLSLDPDDEGLLRVRVMLLATNKDTSEALDCLDGRSDEFIASLGALHPQLLMQAGRLEEAAASLDRFLAQGPESVYPEVIFSVRVEVEARMYGAEAAKELIDAEQRSDLKVAGIAELAIYITGPESGLDVDEGVPPEKLLDEALSMIGDVDSQYAQLMLAHALRRTERWGECAKILEGLVDLVIFDERLGSYIDALLRAGRSAKAKAVIDRIEVGKSHIGLLRLACQYQIQVGDVVGALEWAQSLVGHPYATLRDRCDACRIFVACAREDEAWEVLSIEPDPRQFSATDLVEFASQLHLLGDTSRAIAILARTISEWPNFEDSYLALASMALLDPGGEPNEDPTAVTLDTMVELDIGESGSYIYFVTASSWADVFGPVVSLEDELGRELQGKSIGDEVDLRSKNVGARKMARIVRIRPLMAGVFQRAIAEHQRRFQQSNKLFSEKVMSVGDDGEIDITPLKDMLARFGAPRRRLLSMYESGEIPLIWLAEKVDRYLISPMLSVLLYPNFRVVATSGDSDELELAILNLDEGEELFFDLSSLLAVFAFDCLGLLRKCGKTLSVSSLTVRAIETYLAVLKSLPPSGAIAEMDGAITLSEPSESTKASEIEWLETLLASVSADFQVLKRDDGNVDDKIIELASLFPDPAASSALTAVSRAAVLVSEDNILRQVVGLNGDGRACWIHSILWWCKLRGVVELEEYIECTSRLAAHAYGFIPIDTDDLRWCVQGRQLPKPALKSLLRSLEHGVEVGSAIRVLSSALGCYRVELDDVDAASFKSFVYALLDAWLRAGLGIKDFSTISFRLTGQHRSLFGQAVEEWFAGHFLSWRDVG